MTAEERRKASGPAYRAAAGPPASRRGNWLVRHSALRLPLLGSKDILGSKDVLGSKDTASRPFEASFLEADPDANRIAGMQFRVVIARLPVLTSVCVAV